MPYKNFAGDAYHVGQEIWVKAIVTDPCTSCVGVSIPTIHAKPISSYVKPENAKPKEETE
jgi:hypothetical protein